MQVGDILEMEPTMEGTSGLGTDGPQRCTVVWIHPDKRFFVVEFRSRITGETWREAFWPKLEPQPKNWRGQPLFKAVGATV